MSTPLQQTPGHAGTSRAATEVDRLCRGLPLRAKSLIVTIFGDSLVVHGGGAWLGSLIALARPFGVSERRVRTAVYRLRQDGWLTARKSGRISYYRLTSDAQRQFQNAEKRIYGTPVDTWDGKWTFVLLSGDLPERERAALIRELKWAGFAALATNILAYPGGMGDETDTAGLPLAPRDRMLTLEATTLPGYTPAMVRRMIAENWKLEEIRDSYSQFVDDFEPVEQALVKNGGLDEQRSFLLRTLLIDRFRRILLKDPALPLALLPEHWPGRRAADLTRNVYRLTALDGQAYVARNIEGEQAGPTRPLPASFLSRFGGL